MSMMIKSNIFKRLRSYDGNYCCGHQIEMFTHTHKSGMASFKTACFISLNPKHWEQEKYMGRTAKITLATKGGTYATHPLMQDWS
jgi:hypothetical protein